MPNELLWLVFIVVELAFAVCVFRLFGRMGLYGLIVANIILCNVQVAKQVTLLGIHATLGNVLYATIFFATDVLGELYGKREARRGVWLGFAALIGASIAMKFAVAFRPNEFDQVHGAMEELFGFLPRIAAGSLVAYLVSQLHDVWAFDFWRKKTRGRHLWLRNNLSTMGSQFLDSFIFCFIAFAGREGFPFKLVVELAVSTYLLKLLVAVIDTPFIYLAVQLGRRGRIPDA